MENVRSKSWRVYRARCTGSPKSEPAAPGTYTSCMPLQFCDRRAQKGQRLQKFYCAAAKLRVVKKDTTTSNGVLMPILDLRKAPSGSANFTYSVSAVLAPEHRATGELFDSVESCLYDAGMALKNYFDGVQIRYDGIALGTYAVSRLVNDPLGLFDDLLQRLIATFRMRTRGYVTAPRPDVLTAKSPHVDEARNPL